MYTRKRAVMMRMRIHAHMYKIGPISSKPLWQALSLVCSS
jgi:hypothetical protein